MKIAVTGHTSGIGKTIYDLLGNENQVVGYSLDNGYDISKEHSRLEIITACKDVDVFINNAYHTTGQLDILKKLLVMWQGQNKIIINIGSKVIFYKAADENVDADYIASKKKLQDVVTKNREGLPKLCNVIVGWSDTEMAKHITYPKVSTLEVANFVKYTIENRTSIWIQEAVICSPDCSPDTVKLMDQQ